MLSWSEYNYKYFRFSIIIMIKQIIAKIKQIIAKIKQIMYD